MEDQPYTCFMAGAPGSGKTEFLENYIPEFFGNYVVADADQIRDLLPGYNGKNAHKFQKAASKGVDILYEKSLRKRYNIFIDGTFSLSIEKCRENIRRSIKRERHVVIFYIYTHPEIAWMYSKKREYLKGRKIKMRVFIKSLFEARNNINKIKEEFGDRVYIVGIKSGYGKDAKYEKIVVDINNVDKIGKIGYNHASLYLRIIYANFLLQRVRLIWFAKKILKRLIFLRFQSKNNSN